MFLLSRADPPRQSSMAIYAGILGLSQTILQLPLPRYRHTVGLFDSPRSSAPYIPNSGQYYCGPLAWLSSQLLVHKRCCTVFLGELAKRPLQGHAKAPTDLLS